MSQPNFPKHTRAAQTGNKGIRIVENIVHDRLGWILREQEGQKDFGIDAHIELMNGDKVLGRMLAAQIKCGKSYFKSKNEDGYIYYGEQKHLNYFLNYSIPVILILCDPETEKCFWCEVDAVEMEETETGWQITVPFNQVFDASAQNKLAAIAGSAQDYLPDMQQYWFVNDLLQKYAEMLLLVVDRHKHIEAGDISDVLNSLNRLFVKKKLTKKYKERVDISVYGYDEDPRALYEIPEVRSWFRQLDQKFPFWFYFLSKQGGGIKLITLSICNYTLLDNGQIMLDANNFQHFMEDHFIAMNRICESLGFDEEEIFNLSQRVFSYYERDGKAN